VGGDGGGEGGLGGGGGGVGFGVVGEGGGEENNPPPHFPTHQTTKTPRGWLAVSSLSVTSSSARSNSDDKRGSSIIKKGSKGRTHAIVITRPQDVAVWTRRRTGGFFWGGVRG